MKRQLIIYSLYRGLQEDKYYSLNYKGSDVCVQLKPFADGRKRAICKVPTELGGDNQYRLFNEWSEWKKDVAGFSVRNTNSSCWFSSQYATVYTYGCYIYWYD